MIGLFKRLLVSFSNANALGVSMGFDVSVETLLGRIRLTPGATNGGVYEHGTVRVESGKRDGVGVVGRVRVAFERAEFSVAVIDGVIRQAMLRHSERDVFGADFVPRDEKLPAMYVDATGKIFDIGLLPTSASSTTFLPTEGFWHRGQALGRFQNRSQGIGLQGVFQNLLKIEVVEGSVAVLDPNIQPDGRVVRGSFLIRPDPRIVLDFDSLRVFLHVVSGAITTAQLFSRNGKIAQAELPNLGDLGTSTRLTFPEDV